MSQMYEDVRALRMMVNELRAEPPPELPWDAIEQRLLSKIDAQDRVGARSTAPRLASSSFSRAIGFAAAAAVLALGIGSIAGSGQLATSSPEMRRPIEAAAVALAPGGDSAHDLAALRAGDVIEAGDAPIRFGQPGLVTWTLAARSALRVRSTGVGHTVALERGSIRAEVTPRDPSEGLVEAFAVEVGGTRVAVHGTAFSVTIDHRGRAQAIVDVEHGAVAVGPIGYAGAATGHLLVGPSRASFSLDGGRTARLLERADPSAVAAASAPAAESPVEPSSPAPPVDHAESRPGASPDDHPGSSVTQAPGSVTAATSVHGQAHLGIGASAPPLTVASQAAPEPPRLTAALVQARLDRCFRQAFEPGALAPGFSASHTLRIDVKPDGSVLSATFDPPLKPEMRSCAGGAIYGGRFADDAGHLDIPITFQP